MQMQDAIKVKGQKTMTELPDIKKITHQKKNSMGEREEEWHMHRERGDLGSRQRACLMKSYRRSHTERASVIRLLCLHRETSQNSLNR